MSEILLGEEMIIESILLCSVELWKRFSTAQYFKHILTEHFFILLSPALENNVTEVREVDETIPRHSVAEVHDVLLHGVQPQVLHGRQQVLHDSDQIKQEMTIFLI